jgi:hypothetical protein
MSLPASIQLYVAGLRPTSVTRFTQGGPNVRLLVHVDGTRSVVKWFDRQPSTVLESASLVQLLSDRGWPFPAIRDIAGVGDFTVTHEDFVAGEHPSDITESAVLELITLSMTSRNTPHQRSDWSDRLLANLKGADPKIHPATLEASEFGRTLLRETARAVSGLRIPSYAVIHGDFSPGNTLVSADGSIVGIVDWEGVTVGDSAFDLVTLEWDLELWGRSVRQMLPVLREELDRVSSSRTRRAYRLYLTCRNLSWAAGSSDERAVVATARRILALDSPEAGLGEAAGEGARQDQ